MKTRMIAAAVLTGVALVLVGCGTPSIPSGTVSPTPTTNAAPVVEPTPTTPESTIPAPATLPPRTTTTLPEGVYKFGQAATWPDGLVVTVYAPKPYKPTAEDSDKPNWTVEVLIENLGTELYHYTSGLFEAQDANAVAYDSALMSKIGTLGGGDLIQTRKVRGTVGFEMDAEGLANVTLNDIDHIAVWEQ
jgi:hypothetical protein